MVIVNATSFEATGGGWRQFSPDAVFEEPKVVKSVGVACSRSSSARSSIRVQSTACRRWPAVALALALAVASGACDRGSSTTAPTDTTTVTTVADPAITEVFNGRVVAGGAAFYSFSVTSNGTVNLTLAAVTGLGVPSTVWLGLGIGTPNGEDCSTTTSLSAQAASVPQITGTYAPGVYCVRVYDVGNLAAPASFSVAIAHP